MSLSKLSGQAQTQVPESETQAQKESPVTTEAASTSLALSLPGADGASLANALSCVLADDSTPSNAFPIVEVSGGNTGGMFQPASFQPQEIQDLLPSGKKPVDAVFVAYRMAATSWPVGFNDREEDSKPVWSIAVPANNGPDGKLITKAARNYQFTASAKRDKFDADKTDGVGHMRPQVEVLVYLPDTEGLVVFRTCAGYSPFTKTLTNMAALVDKATGQLGQFPCQIKPVTEEESSKGSGNTWKVHSIQVSPATNQQKGGELFAEYETFIRTLAADPALVMEVNDWISGQDRPLTDEVRKALKYAATL